MTEGHLKRCLVMVVEDEFLVALDLCGKLEEMGCTVLGPVESVAKALGILETHEPDIALVDENLSGETIAPVAQSLRRRHIPYMIISGYNAPLTDDPAVVDARRLSKPVTPVDLSGAVKQLFREHVDRTRN